MREDGEFGLRRWMSRLYLGWVDGPDTSRRPASVHERCLKNFQCLQLLGRIGRLLQLSLKLCCRRRSCKIIHADNYNNYNLLDTINVVIDCIGANWERRKLVTF